MLNKEAIGKIRCRVHANLLSYKMFPHARACL